MSDRMVEIRRIEEIAMLCQAVRSIDPGPDAYFAQETAERVKAALETRDARIRELEDLAEEEREEERYARSAEEDG